MKQGMTERESERDNVKGFKYNAAEAAGRSTGFPPRSSIFSTMISTLQKSKTIFYMLKSSSIPRRIRLNPF